MMKLAIGVVLVTAFLSLQPAAGIVILKDGETYQQRCTVTTSGDSNYIIQFIREKTVIKMFDSTSTISGRVISNDTELDPLITNLTDRYTVFKESGRLGSLVLRITDVRPRDSGHYLCRVFDPNSGNVVTSAGSEELLIRGPLKDLFWTRNHSGLNSDRSLEVPDNGTVLEPNIWHGPLTACVILVSNIQPEINITIGKPGEEGTQDITDQFEIRSATETHIDNIGTGYNATLFFVKRFKFQQASIRDLYCSASQPGSEALNRSVNLQIINKPPTYRQCEPFEFKAPVGSNNITLYCLIPAHPAPEVTWDIGQKGTSVNESSDNPMFRVRNQYVFEGLITTLTITNVTADSFGRYSIDATNSEGKGRMYLQFIKGTINGAGMKDPSLRLMLLLGLLTMWMLKA